MLSQGREASADDRRGKQRHAGLRGRARPLLTKNQQEDIPIIGSRLRGDKRPEDDTTSEMACRPRHIVDAFELQPHLHALG
jgi:hypothetical protein